MNDTKELENAGNADDLSAVYEVLKEAGRDCVDIPGAVKELVGEVESLVSQSEKLLPRSRLLEIIEVLMREGDNWPDGMSLSQAIAHQLDLAKNFEREYELLLGEVGHLRATERRVEEAINKERVHLALGIKGDLGIAHAPETIKRLALSLLQVLKASHEMNLTADRARNRAEVAEASVKLLEATREKTRLRLKESGAVYLTAEQVDNLIDTGSMNSVSDEKETGCIPEEDVCVAHDEPLLCEHGCSESTCGCAEAEGEPEDG